MACLCVCVCFFSWRLLLLFFQLQLLLPLLLVALTTAAAAAVTIAATASTVAATAAAATTAAAAAAAAADDDADATSTAASEHERQLKYSKWRTYQCSHLLENIKHEFLDVETRVDDHYFLEKVRSPSLHHQLSLQHQLVQPFKDCSLVLGANYLYFDWCAS